MSDDSSEHAKPAWSIPAGLITTLVAVVLMQPIAALLVSLYPPIAGWSSDRAEEWLFDSPVANFVTILVFELLSLAVLWIFLHHKRVAFRLATALNRVRWRDLGYAVLGFLAYMGIALFALAALPIVFPIDVDQEQAIGFEPGSGTLTLAMAFMGLVVLPPIVEEIVFRGFLFGTLRTNKVNFAWSMIATSILFGALHLLGGAGGGLLWIGFVDTFVLSLVLCYVREKTGSLWGCIMLHAIKNGVVFLNIFILSI